MLTISRLSRGSVAYYKRTADQARQAAMDRQRANGGLSEYYTEGDTRVPTWVVVGDSARAGELVGLDGGAVGGGFANTDTSAVWLDDGVAPNGAHGRAFTKESVHGFDLMFAAPKSVSLVRALSTEINEKVVAAAHVTAVREAMTYLHQHAGYTRVHNPLTGKKDLERLPGLVAIAYQHETSRCGDPHLHTHVLLPNRQARADGVLVSIDSKSLYHEAKAAGIIYQAVLRRELHAERGFEWTRVDAHSGMAEIAGIDKDCMTAWSQRSTRLREWAAQNLVVVDGQPSAAQLAAAQKATRPAKPESLSWEQLKEDWRADARGLALDRAAHFEARAARRAAAAERGDRRGRGVTARDVARGAAGTGAPGAGEENGADQRTAAQARTRGDGAAAARAGAAAAPDPHAVLAPAQVARMAARIDKAAFTRADMVEMIGAQVPVDVDGDPRRLIEAMVDQVGIRVSAGRERHHREGHEKFTVADVIVEEERVLSMVDDIEPRARLWLRHDDLGDLSPDQARAIGNIASSPYLVQPLQAPAGAGKTHSLKALRGAAHRTGKDVLVLAPTGKAVDEAMRDEAGDRGLTVAKALKLIEDDQLDVAAHTVVVVDEASMVGTPELRKLLSCATVGRAKIVLVGDPYQLSPVKARGGMFEQLCDELPWSQRLGEVWRMRNTEERDASLALRSAHGNRLRKSVGWYRNEGRLHTGDPLAMAEDATNAYISARDRGNDVAIICDKWEMADAINLRLHTHYTDAEEPSVRAARDQHICRGDLIMSRLNDTGVDVRPGPDHHAGQQVDQVRNGNRWRVVLVDPGTGRVAAERVTDRARALFEADYVREHITLGYAATVHSAQGITVGNSDRYGICWSILSEHASRAMAYVAATRAKDENHIAIYQPITGEADHEHAAPIEGAAIHQLRRGNKYAAAHYLHQILHNDDRPRTMHVEAERSDRYLLPDPVVGFLERQDERRSMRRETWRQNQAQERGWAERRDRMTSSSRSADQAAAQSVEQAQADSGDSLEL